MDRLPGDPGHRHLGAPFELDARVPTAPAQPAPLWLGGPSFLSDYGTHGSTAHYLFRFGLFGMKDRLQKSDLLFLGSSHVEFGVSAARLTSELSRVTGRPVRVYNLGSGFGDGIGFAREIIAANALRNKTVVLDLFSPMGEGDSDYARVVSRSNSLGAYLKVWDAWLRYGDDWLLDPVMPFFSTRTGAKLRAIPWLGLVSWVSARRETGIPAMWMKCGRRRWGSSSRIPRRAWPNR